MVTDVRSDGSACGHRVLALLDFWVQMEEELESLEAIYLFMNLVFIDN